MSGQGWNRWILAVVAVFGALATAQPAAGAGRYGRDDYPDKEAACTRPVQGRCPDYDWGGLSTRRFYKRNCTDFVAHRVGITYGSLAFPGGNGNASGWKAGAAASGFKVSSKPRVGAVAWWGATSTNAWGHVAVVTKVNRDGSARVEEYNQAGDGRYSNTRDVRAQAYLYVGKLQREQPQASAPVGKLERATGAPGDRVRVQGWTFDPDGPRFAVKVEAWIDGRPGDRGARRVALGPASRPRADVARAHEGAGAQHGFDVTIDDVPAGRHTVRVYGLNRSGGGGRGYLGGKTVNVPEPAAEPEPEPVGDDPVDPVDEPGGGGPAGPGFVLANAFDGVATASFLFGATGDVPLAGDWDGDGVSTPGVYRRATGTWMLSNTLGGPATIVFNYGRADYLPLVGDWDGDGRDSQGVFRPSDARWILGNELAQPGTVYLTYGRSTDVPLVGDWNGDRKDTIGVFRPESATWHLSNQLGGPATLTFSYGRPSDIPLVGDWNGDGADSHGVFRPTGAAWYLAGGPAGFTFGRATDTPLVGDWNGDRIDTPGVFRQ